MAATLYDYSVLHEKKFEEFQQILPAIVGTEITVYGLFLPKFAS